MSDQLRHPGNELPEFVHSNRCPNPGGASGQRRLQSQLFDTAACLQTAVLNGHCRSPDWLKFKNPAAPAVKRDAEADWFRS
jgi:hypothetical protein